MVSDSKAAPQPKRAARGEDGIAAGPRVVQAMELLDGGEVLLIEHAGERYQLRLTRNGKLILTK